MYALYDGGMIYKKAADDSLLRFRPSDSGEQSEYGKIDGAVAWLSLTDTNIDYPVMQGTDNTKYINTDPYGEFSMSGSIFLDYRNSPDFSDVYSLVYGHHMEHGFMFGALDSYLDKEFALQHREGKLITDEKTYDISIFSVVEAPAEEEAIFNPIEGGGPDKYLKKHAVYMLPHDETEKIIALSTCKYPETTDRTIVFGTLSENTDEAGKD
jgi:sortase B